MTELLGCALVQSLIWNAITVCALILALIDPRKDGDR